MKKIPDIVFNENEDKSRSLWWQQQNEEELYFQGWRDAYGSDDFDEADVVDDVKIDNFKKRKTKYNFLDTVKAYHPRLDCVVEGLVIDVQHDEHKPCFNPNDKITYTIEPFIADIRVFKTENILDESDERGIEEDFFPGMSHFG